MLAEEKLLEPTIMVIVREVSRFLRVDENLVAVYSMNDFEGGMFPDIPSSITVLLYSTKISEAGLEYVNQRAKEIGMAVKDSATTDDGIDTLLKYYLKLFHERSNTSGIKQSAKAIPIPSAQLTVAANHQVSLSARPVVKISVKNLVRLMFGIAPSIKPKQMAEVMSLLGFTPSMNSINKYRWDCKDDPIYMDGKNRDHSTVLSVVDRAWLEAIVRVTGVTIPGVEVMDVAVTEEASLVVQTTKTVSTRMGAVPLVDTPSPAVPVPDLTLNGLVMALVGRIPNMPISRQLRLLAAHVDETADAMTKLELARQLATEAALLEQDGVAMLRQLFTE